MSLANPIWLWGLMALTIPVIIHLLNRRQSRILYFGSLRHLRTSSTRQSLHLKINEIALLVLRCAIIVILVLLLSRLHFTSTSNDERWVVVEDGLQLNPEGSAIIDSLQRNGYLLKFLAPGFPDDPADIPGYRNNYWTFAEALDQSPASHVVVLSYGYAERFWGRRPARPSKISWLNLQPTRTLFSLRAVAFSADSATARQGTTSAEGTTFVDKKFAARTGAPIPEARGDSTTVVNPDTLHISLVSDSAFHFDAQLITAAIQAVAESIPSIVRISHQPPDQMVYGGTTDWIIWLSQRPFTNSPDINCIVYYGDVGSSRALTRVPAKANHQHWALHKRLNESVLVEEGLVLQLAGLLGSSAKLNQVAERYDHRVLPEEMMWAAQDGNATESSLSPPEGNTPAGLVMLLLGTLLVERFIAYRRNQ